MSQGKCPHCGAKITEDAATAERCDLCGGELGRPATKSAKAASSSSASKADGPKNPPPAAQETKEGRFPVVWALVAAAVVLGAVPIFCARSKARQTPGETPSSARPIETPAKRAAMSRQPNPENDAEFKKFGGADGFDVLGYLSTALQHARELTPDAELLRIEARSVGDTGRADLTVVGSSVTYRFRAPSLAKRDESKPATFGVRLRCSQVVTARQRGVNWHPTDGSVADCNRQVLRAPVCTVPQLWTRALAAGAPPGATGRFTYSAPGEEKESRFGRRPMRIPGIGALPSRLPGGGHPGRPGRKAPHDAEAAAKEPKEADAPSAAGGNKDLPIAGSWRVEVDSGKAQVFTIDLPDDCTGETAPAPAAAPN